MLTLKPRAVMNTRYLLLYSLTTWPFQTLEKETVNIVSFTFMSIQTNWWISEYTVFGFSFFSSFLCTDKPLWFWSVMTGFIVQLHNPKSPSSIWTNAHSQACTSDLHATTRSLNVTLLQEDTHGHLFPIVPTSETLLIRVCMWHECGHSSVTWLAVGCESSTSVLPHFLSLT